MGPLLTPWTSSLQSPEPRAGESRRATQPSGTVPHTRASRASQFLCFGRHSVTQCLCEDRENSLPGDHTFRGLRFSCSAPAEPGGVGQTLPALFGIQHTRPGRAGHSAASPQHTDPSMPLCPTARREGTYTREAPAPSLQKPNGRKGHAVAPPPLGPLYMRHSFPADNDPRPPLPFTSYKTSLTIPPHGWMCFTSFGSLQS